MTEAVYEERKNDNFCCRACEKPNEAQLLADLYFLLDHACQCESMRIRISARVRADYAPDRMAQDAITAYCGALRVGLIGYYGFGNFGDEMMLKAIRKSLCDAGVQEILPLMRAGKRGELSRRHPIRAARMLQKCDLVLFGGGNLLQNETSPRSFFYYALLLLFCRRETLVGVGMGIGALRGWAFEAMCGRLLRRFSALYFRTEADLYYALRLNSDIKNRARATCDPCLRLEESRHLAKRKKKILVIPMRERNEELLAYLREKRNEGYEIVILCLFPRQDAAVAKKMATHFDASVRTVRSEEDFFSAAADAMLCVSERLHGGIFSLLSHTPCLLFSERMKCTAFERDVATAAKACGAAAPIACVRTRAEARQKEREAKGIAFGFSEIISFLRNR